MASVLNGDAHFSTPQISPHRLEDIATLKVKVEQVLSQRINQFRPDLAQTTTKQRQRLYTNLLEVISTQLVPLRPNRAEPRVTKRRPKSFPRMQQPRSVLKARLVA